MNRLKHTAQRLRHAARYIAYGELPPDPNAQANAIMWLQLGRTGRFNNDTDVAASVFDADREFERDLTAAYGRPALAVLEGGAR